MRRTVLLLICLAVLLAAPAAASGEERMGIVAKVTTEKGPLNLRSRAEDKAGVLTGIPNGTCVLLTEEGDGWCRVVYDGFDGYCKTAYLTILRDADPSLTEYRILRRGDSGEDVLRMKKRLLELGYIRSGSELTNAYNDTAAERVRLFQRQTGMTEDGVASQELQAYLFSERAPVCTQTLPPVRTPVMTRNGENRVICGCCFGEGCECCGFTGWIQY